MRLDRVVRAPLPAAGLTPGPAPGPRQLRRGAPRHLAGRARGCERAHAGGRAQGGGRIPKGSVHARGGCDPQERREAARGRGEAAAARPRDGCAHPPGAPCCSLCRPPPPTTSCPLPLCLCALLLPPRTAPSHRRARISLPLWLSAELLERGSLFKYIDDRFDACEPLPLRLRWATETVRERGFGDACVRARRRLTRAVCLAFLPIPGGCDDVPPPQRDPAQGPQEPKPLTGRRACAAVALLPFDSITASFSGRLRRVSIL